MKIYILFLLLFVILISGCTVGPSDDVKQANKGLVITSWHPVDFETVSPKQPLEFELELANTGESDAKHVKIFLESIDKKKWKIDESNCNQITEMLGKTDGIENSNRCFIKAEAPDIPRGLKDTTNPKVSVIYASTAQATKSLNIKSTEEARRLRESNQPISVSDVLVQTESPIQFEIETKTPINVIGSGFETPVIMRIRNVGGGIVCYPNCDDPQNYDKIKYKIETVGGDISFPSCETNPSYPLNLIDDANILPCTKISLNRPEFSSYPFITISAEYEYKTQAVTSIIVDNSGQI